MASDYLARQAAPANPLIPVVLEQDLRLFGRPVAVGPQQPHPGLPIAEPGAEPLDLGGYDRYIGKLDFSPGRLRLSSH